MLPSSLWGEDNHTTQKKRRIVTRCAATVHPARDRINRNAKLNRKNATSSQLPCAQKKISKINHPPSCCCASACPSPAPLTSMREREGALSSSPAREPPKTRINPNIHTTIIFGKGRRRRWSWTSKTNYWMDRGRSRERVERDPRESELSFES